MHDSHIPEYIQIHPSSSLPFDYIPKRYLTSCIHLANPTSHLVAYKIKTNTPFSYLVKPSTGFICPHNSTTIHITMQPSDYDHNTILNDKFLINARLLEGKIYPPQVNEAAYLKDLFQNMADSQVQTHRLKVNLKFEHGGVGSSEENLETRDTSHIETSPIKEDMSDHSDRGDRSFQTNILSEVFERQGSEKEIMEFCLDEPQEEVASKVGRMIKPKSMVEIKQNTSTLLEKMKMLDKSNSGHFEEGQVVGFSRKKREKLMEMEEHKKAMNEIIKERNMLKEHLENIKKATSEKEAVMKKMVVKNKGEYQFWHILIVAIIGLVLGALMRRA